MGLTHRFRALAEMPAKREFLRSVGFHRTKGGNWASVYSRARVRGRDVRRWTLAELKKHYGHYMLNDKT